MIATIDEIKSKEIQKLQDNIKTLKFRLNDLHVDYGAMLTNENSLDTTLTDKDVASIHQKINAIKLLHRHLDKTLNDILTSTRSNAMIYHIINAKLELITDDILVRMQFIDDLVSELNKTDNFTTSIKNLLFANM